VITCTHRNCGWSLIMNKSLLYLAALLCCIASFQVEGRWISNRRMLQGLSDFIRIERDPTSPSHTQESTWYGLFGTSTTKKNVYNSKEEDPDTGMVTKTEIVAQGSASSKGSKEATVDISVEQKEDGCFGDLDFPCLKTTVDANGNSQISSSIAQKQTSKLPTDAGVITATAEGETMGSQSSSKGEDIGVESFVETLIFPQSGGLAAGANATSEFSNPNDESTTDSDAKVVLTAP